MKRKDALRKLGTICQRLDEADPQTFPVVPLRLYLFGSLLTDKPNPSDVDLLFKYDERPDRDINDEVRRMAYGEPLSHDRAIRILRKGMQMIRFEFLFGIIADWLDDRYFAPDTPLKLVWSPGLDWQPIIDNIAAHPLLWDEVLEQDNKIRQETAKKIAQEHGKSAAIIWLKTQT